MARNGGICGKPTPDGGICHNHLSEWGTTLEGLIYTLCLQGKRLVVHPFVRFRHGITALVRIAARHQTL